MRLVAFKDGPLPADEAMRRADASLAEALAEDDVAVAAYACMLTEKQVVLGAFQLPRHNRLHREHAAVPVIARRTGGVAAFGGEGVAYLAMRLRSASVFLDCPPNRVLNRNVRGALVGLSTAGVAAHYFGRDFLSVRQRPAVLATWTRGEGGVVDLEYFVSVTRTFDAAEFLLSGDEYGKRWQGKKLITLEEAWGRAPDVDELVDRIVRRGYTEKYGMAFAEGTPARDGAIPQRHLPPPELTWSRRHEIPIGSVEAGLRTMGGVVESVHLAGDFMADASLNEALRSRLVGLPATSETFVSAINETFLRSGLHVEGFASLQPVLNAFDEARSNEQAARLGRS